MIGFAAPRLLDRSAYSYRVLTARSSIHSAMLIRRAVQFVEQRGTLTLWWSEPLGLALPHFSWFVTR